MNPVALAVLPLKNEAIVRARQNAEAVVVKVTNELTAANGDMSLVAPLPDGRSMRNDYFIAQGYRSLVSSLVVRDSSKPYRMLHKDPDFVVVEATKVAKFIQNAEETAAEQYEAFVSKLVSKVGTVVEATLEGSHVWGYSKLFVTKENGTKETWTTHQIVNVSKLGKLFNQWPTRKGK